MCSSSRGVALCRLPGSEVAFPYCPIVSGLAEQWGSLRSLCVCVPVHIHTRLVFSCLLECWRWPFKESRGQHVVGCSGPSRVAGAVGQL